MDSAPSLRAKTRSARPQTQGQEGKPKPRVRTVDDETNTPVPEVDPWLLPAPR